MDMNYLSCEDIGACPAECQICNNCLHYLGCTNAGTITASTSGSTIPAAALLTLLAGAGFCVFKRKRENSDEGTLADHFMGVDNSNQQYKNNLWIVQAGFGSSVEQGNSSKSIWLVPVDGVSLSGSDTSTYKSQSCEESVSSSAASRVQGLFMNLVSSRRRRGFPSKEILQTATGSEDGDHSCESSLTDSLASTGLGSISMPAALQYSLDGAR